MVFWWTVFREIPFWSEWNGKSRKSAYPSSDARMRESGQIAAHAFWRLRLGESAATRWPVAATVGRRTFENRTEHLPQPSSGGNSVRCGFSWEKHFTSLLVRASSVRWVRFFSLAMFSWVCARFYFPHQGARRTSCRNTVKEVLPYETTKEEALGATKWVCVCGHNGSKLVRIAEKPWKIASTLWAVEEEKCLGDRSGVNVLEWGTTDWVRLHASRSSTKSVTCARKNLNALKKIFILTWISTEATTVLAIWETVKRRRREKLRWKISGNLKPQHKPRSVEEKKESFFFHSIVCLLLGDIFMLLLAEKVSVFEN